MTEYKIECIGDPRDTLEAFNDGEDIIFFSRHDGSTKVSVYVSPADARTFARGILALADEVDGGEAEPAPDSRPRVGDRLRVTKNNPRSAPAETGDIITVSAVDYDDPNSEDCIRYLAAGDEPGDYQWFVPLSAVEPVSDEPESTSETAKPSRARLLEAAMDAMSGSGTYTASDLIELADYLAGENA
ncbi:hypothetical protein CP967_31370 [Streptomyces nitrosporeus]|uniref:Uncharacterized protein n=1 Tax=Streptomyces nitrosporeus TaxID=28894 RepID=A0A5J6FLX9_9ACTN|nr:hypothetical protein [Streptomyces nitrosporeus]QEU75870.1 hypothetical protein CP967_31370 [Streptomyces nitrosporeus]GGY88988.1 hypothetical protein GCM10010327_19680 [Streptomyces nitrosporeus]